jgi:hypothetical protein
MFNVIKDGQHRYGDLYYVFSDVSMWDADYRLFLTPHNIETI